MSTPLAEAYALAIAERDTARAVAVRLEQENARLVSLIQPLTHDLVRMHADEAIDLTRWPAASALCQWRAP